MVRKLLAERFKFSFHKDIRELSVFTLSARKQKTMLTLDTMDNSGEPGIGFRLAHIDAKNATVDDLAWNLQGDFGSAGGRPNRIDRQG